MMQHLHCVEIDSIRASSRNIARELGLLNETLAATAYPASAVHAILEIRVSGPMKIGELSKLLRLDKPSTERMVRDLVDAGEVKQASGSSAAHVMIDLTAKGKKTGEAIEEYGRTQVSTALASLTPAEYRTVSNGLAAYARALVGGRKVVETDAFDSIRIEEGYQTGAIGRIVEMHATYYSRHAGFGQFFETQVATGVAGFASRIERPCNGLWLARFAGRIVGSVAIDGEDMGTDIAHLRWFIVDEAMRGTGIGRKLLAKAIGFCDDAGFAQTRLWTFAGLNAARSLYERTGFSLAEERPGAQWGKTVTEQLFTRQRAPDATVSASLT